MGKVVTQEDLFTLLQDIEKRLARLERAVYENQRAQIEAQGNGNSPG